MKWGSQDAPAAAVIVAFHPHGASGGIQVLRIARALLRVVATQVYLVQRHASCIWLSQCGHARQHLHRATCTHASSVKRSGSWLPPPVRSRGVVTSELQLLLCTHRQPILSPPRPAAPAPPRPAPPSPSKFLTAPRFLYFAARRVARRLRALPLADGGAKTPGSSWTSRLPTLKCFLRRRVPNPGRRYSPAANALPIALCRIFALSRERRGDALTRRWL